MDNIIAAPGISNETPEHPGLDFKFLRQEGIRYLQKLAGESWTDHNTHDPGITILDILCYALTDLSYRIDFDIKDLLAEETANPYDSLFSPATILTVNPVTILDIRKIIIDVEGVKNAWVEKVSQAKPEIFFDSQNKTLNLSDQDRTAEPLNINGLYRVFVEINEATSQSNNILPNVTGRLNACRSLCEDFAEIKILDSQLIALSGNIEVGPVEDINRFAANILFRVANFISPRIRFYTLEELLNKGKRVDEIFDGPPLVHGFIDDDELRKYDRKTELHTSDVIREIMDEPGVLALNQIGLATGMDDKQNWRLLLDSAKTPRLDRVMSIRNLKFIKNDLELSVDMDKAEKYFIELRDADLYLPLEEKARDIIPETRPFRNIGAYYSIQNHFQKAFGIGEIGLPESASSKRIGQAKQLKAYLMFFEQVLANYFAQVAGMKDLFSFRKNDALSYFHQSLIGTVPGAEEIIASKDAALHEKLLADITETGSDALERKNRFLNHLMARFSESLTDYSLLSYDQVIKDLANQKMQPASPKEESVTPLKLMNDKLNFLKDYPLISNERGKAFDYTRPGWDTANISGLEKRIAAKLGIANYTRRSLAEKEEEGLHLLEHILLRPLEEDFSGFFEQLLPKSITLFEDGGNGLVKCNSARHGLQTDESIQVRSSNGYDGAYVITQVLPDSFEIKAKYAGPGNEKIQNNQTVKLNPTWIRTAVDTKFLILTKPITKFSAPLSGNNNNTLCEAIDQELEDGEVIEITGSRNYNGKYTVQHSQKQTFEIQKKFAGTETGARWISETQRKDPFSLQLTFVFPDWPQRFKNENFRAFIENTIREETPVHLTVYIRWLNSDEMMKFENAFKVFLEQLSNN